MIELKGVTKKVKNNIVLNDIDLQINSGDYIHISGHNGCGKTMLLRMLCGLIKPDSGTVSTTGPLTYGVIIDTVEVS
ncbi:MAG: ATP-binding cassette domain-containing protein [Lachnospiraceae bacterium]|jgi:ABC-2 type transport system ATP-binding protein|nr:ATP-binding cassette domain-containing protein [Lachnospiraceae bacterium]MEE3461350.1 ATP-binding cassette domain-containing protein [Lachnospiraceae bacterium]